MSERLSTKDVHELRKYYHAGTWPFKLCDEVDALRAELSQANARIETLTKERDTLTQFAAHVSAYNTPHDLAAAWPALPKLGKEFSTRTPEFMGIVASESQIESIQRAWKQTRDRLTECQAELDRLRSQSHVERLPAGQWIVTNERSYLRKDGSTGWIIELLQHPEAPIADPPQPEPPRCRHCGEPAVARFKTPSGCVCFPDDREQDLCMQHIVKDGMLGAGVEMIQDYRVPTQPEPVITDTERLDF